MILLLIIPARAQKVGLVLSGGGAKGLTHVGIIRALEENNIPIDYVTGTSMGAIVGSLYAMGYSPDEMVDLLGSDEFRLWYSGQIEDRYKYYFKSNPPTPEFFNIRLSLKDSLNLRPQLLPASVINPVQMNLVFLDLFAQATATSQGNFDKLFVPFRCIASDVYNKEQLVLREGDLGDAVRASMTFPFVFKPIEINGNLAYDGGIYNNFPVDVMRNDFDPDIMIGSVVASNPHKPDEKDLIGQLENMIMQKSDYSLPDSQGILLNFKYTDVNLLDFNRIQELHDIGYNRTMEMMDSIKSRISRRVTADNVELRRLIYKSNFPELRFRRIYINGANPQQSKYIRREFREEENDIFYYEDIKKAYFKLLSDKTISEIIPHASYNKEDETYDLYLKVKLEDNIAIRLGGNISSSNSNQIYLGVAYKDLNIYSKEFVLDGQLGRIYNSVQFMAKIDLPTNIPTSYRFIASISTFDYYKRDKLFSTKDIPAFNKKDERFIKIKLALPFLMRKKAEFGIGLAQIEDRYFQSSVINFEEKYYDRSIYRLWGGSISFNGNSLNHKQFPTQGKREAIKAQIFKGTERFKEGETGIESDYKKNHSWMQISYEYEKYFPLASKFTLGAYMDLYYSSKNFSENYTATMLQAGEFTPTAHSIIAYNDNFRANQYFAGGVQPIYSINNLFHLRGEVYAFIPIFPIERNSLNKAYYGKAFSRYECLASLSAVCQLPFMAISGYVNYYSSPKNNWNFGLTLGWQLFNARFIE
ncbi:MAG: patatin-like phospholipase family protein [Bacteroides sp.]|nr:patatin-like phospholipase family protein [Bacteroides sp.]